MTLREEWITRYGDAYQQTGLPRLMGNVVGLLLATDGPISLDDISDELGVSKGPVSQVMGRLRENHLVQRQKQPGDRKDYYVAVDNIFGQAFANHTRLFRLNYALADEFHQRANSRGHETLVMPGNTGHADQFRARIEEMREFYAKMLAHMNAFLDEWEQTKPSRFTDMHTKDVGERA